jgi:hypothetical protein
MPSGQGRQARLPFLARCARAQSLALATEFSEIAHWTLPDIRWLAPDSRRELFEQLVRLLPRVLRPRGFPVAGGV